MRTAEELLELQSMNLEDKALTSIGKIQEWYAYWNGKCSVSFSGGKDSTVLSDLCAMVCQQDGYDLTLTFANTGLEYPEVQSHVKIYAEHLKRKYNIPVNLVILRPAMRFDEVLINYGYPLVSKEVAEAIYFARKIRGGGRDNQKQRTVARKRKEITGGGYTLSRKDQNSSVRYNGNMAREQANIPHGENARRGEWARGYL